MALLSLPGDISAVHDGAHLELAEFRVLSPPAEFSAHGVEEKV